jgi:small nuclear ribonucleoprotein (snRNP)-like protein
MERLTESNAEDYITSQMVSFLAQSRPFGGTASHNGMRRFYSANVSAVQRAQMDKMSDSFLNVTLNVVLQRLEITRHNKPPGTFWFVGQHFTTRLIFIDLANNSHYSDILVSGDPITNAVLEKAKKVGVFFDFRRTTVTTTMEQISVHN